MNKQEFLEMLKTIEDKNAEIKLLQWRLNICQFKHDTRLSVKDDEIARLVENQSHRLRIMRQTLDAKDAEIAGLRKLTHQYAEEAQESIDSMYSSAHVDRLHAKIEKLQRVVDAVMDYDSNLIDSLKEGK